jgi:8-oxo-dGTP pyrophosphatase MutT (NUDIX family)
MSSQEKWKKFWAGGFLYNSKDGTVLLHHRDGNTKINPNKWAFFGGLNEGPETPVECFVRELREEIGFSVGPEQAIPLREYLNIDMGTYRVIFYVESDVSEDDLTLGEGAGFEWIPLAQVSGYNLTDKTQDDLRYFIKTMGTGIEPNPGIKNQASKP